MSKFEHHATRLSDSSEDDESSFTESEPPSKRPRSMFSLGGTDRSSTDHSLPDDDFQLSDEEDNSFQRSDTNLMQNMVKHAEPNNFVDNKAQKMMVISVEESVSWLEEADHECLTQEILSDWIKDGPKKLTIDDETNFCDPTLLRNVLSSKSVFDKLEPEEMRRARTRSNPFETIRGGFFLNRAAMKMANMDRVFDFMFTKPKDEHDGFSVDGQENIQEILSKQLYLCQFLVSLLIVRTGKSMFIPKL
ncbi:hypothetical protein C0J52_07193 [Blattella germanica]|nr:hypothetical protein C0J52_07193 [Blattella germanica]